LAHPSRRGNPGDRSRGAYTQALLIRAITTGVDAANNRLSPLMPRFALSLSDANALVAYLMRLGTLPEPGLDADTLVIGSVLPTSDSPVGAVLQSYFDMINRGGGLFGRRLLLQVAIPHEGETKGSVVTRIATEEAVFALLAPLIAGDERGAVSAANADGLPMIGPLTPRVRAAPRSRYVFYLNGGAEAEGHALATFAQQFTGTPKIVDDGTGLWTAVADIAEGALADSSAGAQRVRLAAANAEDGPVLWFADSSLARSGVSPQQSVLLLPSALAADVLANGPPAQTFVAFSTGPADVTAEGAAELRALNVPAGRPAVVQALAAAHVLVDALRRAGRDVTRERLVDALESLQADRTGLAPAVTFSPSQHIGSEGVWIVPLDGSAPVWWDR
jgi:ABC-type branched-subunit amino acid transport system substrate-binding protein